MTSAELITELQAARPTADAALRGRVQTIAAAKPQRRSSPFDRLARLSPRRLVFVGLPAAAVFVIAVAGVAGLLDAGSRPQLDSAARESLSQASPGATVAPSTTPAAKAGAPADATTPAPTPGRAQRYSAQLTLAVTDVEALSRATQQALQITRDLGGYLVTVSYGASAGGVSSVTLKVPTANVQDAVVRLSKLGTIVSQQVQIDDLQTQADELTKRETALRGQIASLSARLAKTNLDAATRATLVARRDAARSELARVRSARAQVETEARFATIQLTLQTDQASIVPVIPSRWDRSLDRAGEILATEAIVVLYVLVIAGPLALLGALLWLGRRELRRRQDEQLLAAP